MRLASKKQEALYGKRRRGLSIYEPEKCYDCYVLFTTCGSNTFYLIDKKGKVVHRWLTSRLSDLGEILPNGHLLYGKSYAAIIEVDWNSKPVWYYPCPWGHDFAVMPNGHIIINCEGNKRFNRPDIFEGCAEGLAYESPYLLEIDPKTYKVFWQWWPDDHIEELKKVGVEFPRRISERTKYREGDIFHNNTCEVLPDTRLGREDPRFKAGNVVFSFRQLDVVGVIDKETGKIVWAWGPGILDGQHQPTLIPDFHPITGEPMPGAGHFLIFDNGRYRRDFSRVLEVDPKTNKIVWSYTAPNPTDFYSWHLGGAERLPNGNTLICDSHWGRLFEVTPDGEIVWEYLNPFSVEIPSKGPDSAAYGDLGQDMEHRIYRCVPYPREYIEQFL